MADTTFMPGFVPQRTRDRIQRAAVLYAIQQPWRTSEEISEGTLKLQNRWRTVASRWMRAGWTPRKPLDDGEIDILGLQYLRNCCPAFVYMTPRTKPCRVTLCPFCYARWVGEVWDKVRAAFVDLRTAAPDPLQRRIRGRAARLLMLTDETEPQPSAEWQLVERRHEFNLPFSAADGHVADSHNAKHSRYVGEMLRRPLVEDLSSYTEWLSLGLDGVNAGRRAWWKKIDFRGGLSYTVVEPWASCWHVEQRQLMQLAATTPMPEVASEKDRLVRHRRPTTGVLFKALARTLAYPRGVLYSEPALMAVLLHARRGRRLFATYGSFRGSLP